MKSDRSRSLIRIEALVRYFMLHTAARFNHSILITEFPKCGGTWLSQMLAEILAIPFPRNQFPTFNRSIFQGHYIYDFPCVKKVVVWRDPRDMVVSWYHHTLFKSETNNSTLINTSREYLNFKDFKDIRSNLPKFIEFMFTKQNSPHFTWNDFFDVWSSPKVNVFHTNYESLRLDTLEQLTSLLNSLNYSVTSQSITKVINKYSFENMSGRKPGEEKEGTFLRKALVGDWKNIFSNESIDILEYYTDGRLSKYKNLMSDLDLHFLE